MHSHQFLHCVPMIAFVFNDDAKHSNIFESQIPSFRKIASRNHLSFVNSVYFGSIENLSSTD